MGRKYTLLGVLCLCLAGLLVGCGAPDGAEDSRIEAAVLALYESDYDYTRTTENTFLDASDNRVNVLEGQRFASPYKEHVKFLPEESTAPATSGAGQREAEYYYQEMLSGTRALISQGDGWVEQLLPSRPHIPGDGEVLQFSYVRDDSINGQAVEVYAAEYVLEDLDKGQEAADAAGDAASATVKQEYYLDKEHNVLVRIVTDFSEYSKKIDYLLSLANGASAEEAKQAMDEVLTQIETLDIYNIGNATPFDIPEA